MVTDDVYGQLSEKLEHLSGQLDIMNHSLYVQNEHLSWITVSIMLLAALAIFSVGYMITRR